VGGNSEREKKKKKKKGKKQWMSLGYLTLLPAVPSWQTDRWASSSCLTLCWTVMHFKNFLRVSQCILCALCVLAVSLLAVLPDPCCHKNLE
jgi:hypothetical protein